MMLMISTELSKQQKQKKKEGKKKEGREEKKKVEMETKLTRITGD